MDAEFQVSLLAMSKLPGVVAFVSRLQAYRACTSLSMYKKSNEEQGSKVYKERRCEKDGIVL